MWSRQRIEINKTAFRNLIMYVFLFPFPIFEQINQNFDAIFKISQIAIFAMCVFQCYLKKKSIGRYGISIICLFFYCLGLNIFWGIEYLGSFVGDIAFPLLSTLFFSMLIVDEEYKITVHYIAFFYMFACILNLLMMLGYPEGIVVSAYGASSARACWLFGSKNNVIHFLPQIILFVFLDMELNEKRFKNMISLVCLGFIVLSMGPERVAFMEGSLTAVALILIVLLCYAFRGSKLFVKTISIMKIDIVAMFSFFLMLILCGISESDLIADILNGFGKDISFSGRNSVWAMCVEKFWDSPIWGHGQQKFTYFLFWKSYLITNYEYSFWLAFLVRYGIIGVALIFFVFTICDDRYKKVKDAYVFRIAFLLSMISGLVYFPNLEGIILITSLSALYGTQLKG